jgi:serine/threonine protein kinase
MGKVIGEGTFGKVYKGFHLPTSQDVAVKVLEKQKIKEEGDLNRIQS